MLKMAASLGGDAATLDSALRMMTTNPNYPKTIGRDGWRGTDGR